MRDITRNHFSSFLSTLHSNPETKGKHFESFVKWFLINDPYWSTQVEKVWLWKDWPGKWDIDKGIDLVFEHKNGEIWAVQSKCYDSEYYISKEDIDSFLSESSRQVIHKRLLIATTDRIGRNGLEVLNGQEKPVIRFLLSHFERSNITFPSSMQDLIVVKPKELHNPKPYQAEAISAVVGQLATKNRGQLIMACGTGKTYTSLWIKEQLKSQSTLVFLPSLGLLSQTLHEWVDQKREHFDVLCVCSDVTVGKKEDDEMEFNAYELGFPVTSHVEEIKAFLLKSGPKVIFSTYHSSPLIALAQKDLTILPFDLVIADEAHRCAGKVSSDFSIVLDESRIRANKRLFATATPRIYSSNLKKAAQDRGTEIVGMDDSTVFGEVLHSYPFGKAIDENELTDYRVIIIGVDSPMVAQWIGDRELLKTHSGIETDAEALAMHIGVLKAIKDYDLRRVISFHSRVKRAENFTKDIQDVANWIEVSHKPSGTLRADYVSGGMATDKRRTKLQQLKTLEQDERMILSNARCLSEGVDVPSLDGVAFIDPRNSTIDIIQAVGRAIRKSENKSLGTIILPVFLENTESAEACIEASDFKPIWDVLNALKAHDDVLAENLSKMRTRAAKEPGTPIDRDEGSKIIIDMPMAVAPSFANAIRTHIVEQLSDSWDFWYGLLLNYLEEHGDCLVSARYKTADGFNLGQWVGTQRQTKDMMPVARKERLEALQGWAWDWIETRWEQGFAYLISYHKECGDFLVPNKYKTPDGFNLGGWVLTQRQSKDTMPISRKERLEALQGWVWDALEYKWELAFKELGQYAKKYGDCLVPVDFVAPDGFNLGQWVGDQRKAKDTMPATRKERLEVLGRWVWDVIEDQWEQGFEYLVTYCKECGDSLVPGLYKTQDGFYLGNWVGKQRQSKNTMPATRKERLEALQGWAWDPIEAKWEEGFDYLVTYCKEHGDYLVSAKYKTTDGFNLGRWVSTQRQSKNTMPATRKERLEALQGWVWDPIEAKWEEGFDYLATYCKEHGDYLVSAKYKTTDGFNLGNWVGKQRQSKNTMPATRKERLEALQGWVWKIKGDYK